MPQGNDFAIKVSQPDLELIRLSREAIIIWKPDGTIIQWNPSAERILGYPANQVIQQPLSRIVPENETDRLELIAERIRQGETIANVEMRWRKIDGRYVDVLFTFSPLRDEVRNVVAVVCLGLDVSERNRLKHLEREHLFLNAAVSSAEDGIICNDLDGNITSWNQGAERLFGYRADEMIRQPVSLLIPPDRRGEEFQILEQVHRGEQIQQYETRWARKDGRIVDLSLTVSPVKDRIGRLIGASKIVREITDRKRFERAERDQALLASIVSSADDAIVTKDLHGVITSWNQGAEKLFGYTAEEMIGQPVLKLIPPGHRDEEPKILERIRRGERIEHYESIRVRKDGRTVEVSLSISPVRNRMGQVIGASKIARDISERKRWQTAELAQSFLGSLIEFADDAIISKNLDGIITSWNPAAEKLFGYAAKEMIGKPFLMLIPTDHANEEDEILQRIRRGERILHYETKRMRKDGSLIDVSLTVSPIKDSLGQIIGASKIARDITEIKRSQSREREILRHSQEAARLAVEARAQAEQANSLKDEFLATISHELRTPITSILGWTRLLTTGQLTPERQQKALTTIDRNARSQAQLIEDLLDVSRIVSGKLRVDFKKIDLPAVIAAAVEALRPAAEAKGIRVDSVFRSGAGPILGDAERLQQVVWNLLSNAIKFTPPSGTVRIELQRVESQVELRIADSGIGIDPAFVSHVFERFSQADSSIKRRRGGIGMGLAIVKSLVELHGGVVSVFSEGEGKGTVFTVKLPISALREDSIRRQPAEKPALQAELRRREDLVGLKILIVDDEPDTCEMLRFVFNECGAIVETAETADAALDLFDQWHPDILISDIGMPDVDGYELIRLIRNDRNSQIPAVALTAMARIEDRLKALTAGYQMHVPKPVEPVELITIVSSLVALVNRRSEL